MYYAVIGDIISSRSLEERMNCQQRLNDVLSRLNEKYQSDIAAKFLITLGDEFQGLLSSPEHLPDMIEFISFEMRPVSIRFGIGAGEMSTEINEYALGSDGSAYHRAREAVEEIKKQEKRNRSFEARIRYSGFDSVTCELINAVAAGQFFIEKRWTQKQCELISLMLGGEHTQKSVAKLLGITQSSVNSRLKASGYYDYLYMKNVIAKALTERRCKNE